MKRLVTATCVIVFIVSTWVSVSLLSRSFKTRSADQSRDLIRDSYVHDDEIIRAKANRDSRSLKTHSADQSRDLIQDSYIPDDEIIRAMANRDFTFVNQHILYGRFVVADEELEFHYVHEPGVTRVVYWGSTDDRIREIRKSGLAQYLGMTLLSDSEHEEKRVAGIEHEYPRIYDVVFQTNRKYGKVAIMDGGSNVFPYADKRDEPSDAPKDRASRFDNGSATAGPR